MIHGLVWVLLIAALFIAALIRVFLINLKPQKTPKTYVLKPSLVTPAERSFLGCLDSILPPDIRVFTKVRLADLFEVEKTVDPSAWQSAFNKINSKHVDFILCQTSDLRPLLAIELDDKTHAREARQRRDAFIENIFAASEIKLLRFAVQRAYRPEEIARQVKEALAPARNALH